MACSLNSGLPLLLSNTRRVTSEHQAQHGSTQPHYPTNLNETASLADDCAGQHELLTNSLRLGRTVAAYPTVVPSDQLCGNVVFSPQTPESVNLPARTLDLLSVMANEQTGWMLPQEKTEDRTPLEQSLPCQALQAQSLPPCKASVYYCWSHGCDGRSFSSLANYRRHIREKSGIHSKVACPQCGQQFVRISARDQHLAKRRCKRIEVDDNGVTRRTPMFRKSSYN